MYCHVCCAERQVLESQHDASLHCAECNTHLRAAYRNLNSDLQYQQYCKRCKEYRHATDDVDDSSGELVCRHCGLVLGSLISPEPSFDDRQTHFSFDAEAPVAIPESLRSDVLLKTEKSAFSLRNNVNDILMLLHMDDLKTDATLVSEWVKMVKHMRGSHMDKETRLVVGLYLCLKIRHFPIDKLRLCEFLKVGINDFQTITTRCIQFIEKRDTEVADRIVRSFTAEKKQVSPFHAFGKTFSVPEQQQQKMLVFLNHIRREIYCKEESLCAAIASIIVKNVDKNIIADYYGVNAQTIRNTVLKMKNQIIKPKKC
jgi:transcription initiation factor TFIIIB Brf1 subunit/transcription initiation factor TFIIB